MSTIPKIWWNSSFDWIELRGGNVSAAGVEIDSGSGFQPIDVLIQEPNCLLIDVSKGFKAIRGPGWLKKADKCFSVERDGLNIRAPAGLQMTLHFEADPRFSEGLGIDGKVSNGKWMSLEGYRLNSLWRHAEIGLTDDDRVGPSFNCWLPPEESPLIHLMAKCADSHQVVLSVDSRFSPAPLSWLKQSRSKHYSDELGEISVNLAIEPYDCKRHMLYDRLAFLAPIGFKVELTIDGHVQLPDSVVVLEKRASSTKRPWRKVLEIYRDTLPMFGSLYPSPLEVDTEAWGLFCCRLPTYAKTLTMTQEVDWIDQLPDELCIADISPEQMRWVLHLGN